MYRGGADEKCEEMKRSNSKMKVVVRIRPETEAETRTGCPAVVKAVDDHVLVFDPLPDNTPAVGYCCAGESKQYKKPLLHSQKQKDLRFGFDRVFDATGTQMEVFQHTTKDIVNDLLDGINCSVFAYGATGAGKTYTMLGDSSSPGVMFYTMLELYTKIDELKDEKICEVGVSYLEIYNETIRDLIVPSGALELREDHNQGLVVSGLTMHQPKTADEILNFLTIGNRNRTQHPTDANASSSRSHAVFQIYVNQKSRTSGVRTMVTQGKLSLIDLAGSERATVTTNRGARLREGANINKSLLALGNCINALAENKGKAIHIPYRNSKLTRLLKDSLGGNCRTVMITNISPSGLSYEDTYNTLKYADRAQQIKTSLARNVVNVDLHVTKYRSIIQDLQKEISELKQKLQLQVKTPNVGGTVYNSTEAIRLEAMVHSVYSERSHLRKAMSDLDATERDILLRVYRKERDLERIKVSSNSDSKRSKTQSQMDIAQSHLIEVQKQKQVIHERLQSNRDSINDLQHQINRAIGSAGPNGSILKRHMELLIESRKLDVEGAHQWKQIKHLLKYIKSQEKEISKTEKFLLRVLELASKQHQLLISSRLEVPSYIEGLYLNVMRMAEGDREVLWADQSIDMSQDTSAILPPSQRNILDTMIMYCSPGVKKESPLTSLGGILTKRSCLSMATELSSSDADSSITGVSSYSPRLVLSEKPGLVTRADQPPVSQNGDSASGRPNSSPVERQHDGVAGEVEISRMTTECSSAFKVATRVTSSAGCMNVSLSMRDHLRTADRGGIPSGKDDVDTSLPSKLINPHSQQSYDSQPRQGHVATRLSTDLHPSKTPSSSGSAFRPLSQQPTSGVVRKVSSLSKATMIRSPPPPPSSKSHTTASSVASGTSNAPSAVTMKATCKTLAPPTPHVSAAANKQLGFEDNFVSPMVFKNHGSSAFSRVQAQENGRMSLMLSPSQRRRLDTNSTADGQCTGTNASSSPQNVHNDDQPSASTLIPSSLVPPIAAQDTQTHLLPSVEGPLKERMPDLNSTFTIESLPSQSQNSGSYPLSNTATSGFINGAAITDQLQDIERHAAVSPADVGSESAAHKGNLADSSSAESNSSVLQPKKAPSFMALTKSATYKRVQSAWTRMNINKENEITAGPVVVRSLSKSKRIQSLSGSNLAKQSISTL